MGRKQVEKNSRCGVREQSLKTTFVSNSVLVLFLAVAHVYRRCWEHDFNCLAKGQKDISSNATYDIFAMNAIKRVVVEEGVWADLSRMREPGMTFSRLIANMIEHEKKRRLVQDILRVQEEEDLVEIEL
jgi:predicted CopG family antitoxin